MGKSNEAKIPFSAQCTLGNCGYSEVQDKIDAMFFSGKSRPSIDYTLRLPNGCNFDGNRGCAAYGQFISTIVTLYLD